VLILSVVSVMSKFYRGTPAARVRPDAARHRASDSQANERSSTGSNRQEARPRQNTENRSDRVMPCE
jgi:hypothetical protein